MNKLHIDIETYSSVDLIKSGVHKYAESPDFEVLLLAWAWNDKPVQIVDLASGEPLPAMFLASFKDKEVVKVAHNASFERVCLNAYGLETEVHEWECTATKAAYCGLPFSLKQVGEALNIEKAKLSEGKELIRYFCLPCKPTKTNGHRTRNLPHHAPEKWTAFKGYCIRDVEAEQEIDHTLEPYTFPVIEQLNYLLDQEINDRGVLVDTEFAQKCIVLNETYISNLLAEAKQLSGLENPNSVAQLKKWISTRSGKTIDSLNKAVVGELLKEDLPQDVLRILSIRKQLGKTSVKKFTAMIAGAADDNRAKGTLKFYGANRTGRWAGRRIQMQNIPKNKGTTKQLRTLRNAVETLPYEDFILLYPNVSGYLSQLIRTALVAGPGKILAVADFSAIEARVLAWLAGEQWRLDVFNTHGKIYEASASQMFGVPLEQITKGSELRSKGKVAELALGYQGAVGALKQMGGEKMGLSESEMRQIVNKWRRASPAIVHFWETVEKAALRAVANHKKVPIRGGSLVFDFDGKCLTIQLPSKRKLFYFEAFISSNQWGRPCIKYKGIKQETRKWANIDTYGGKIAENITQAVARDLLAYAMRNIKSMLELDIVFHVHDEAVCEIPLNGAEQTLEDIYKVMCIAPIWATDLPLKADGEITPFYKK